MHIKHPVDSLLQRITYSSYYGGNVLKAGVHVQPCGWMGCYEAFPGAISCTEYFEKCGCLEEQQIFQSTDGNIPFINILDRGYRSTQAAWKRGQFVLQPVFILSDKKFSTKDCLRAAEIAADRSGNERAVWRSKHCNYLKYGVNKLNSAEVNRLCDVWLCHGFQSNFMYKSNM